MNIFLSFASGDRTLAESIQMALRGAGHGVFFDKASLPPGSDYNSRIRRAIDRCDVYVFLISPSSTGKRRYVETELALVKVKWPNPWGHVLPVIVAPTSREKIDPYLAAVTYLEPRGNIAAEVAAEMDRLLPHHMAKRVLFADDQIPWRDKKRDAKVRAEIVRELGKKLREQGKDPKQAYEQDKLWMGELIRDLSVTYGFEVIPEREYHRAEQRIKQREKYDIYIIDLSWNGDPKLGHGERKDVGLKLLKLIATYNPETPVIAFSQNFEKDAGLMSRVFEQNAFPMQKHYKSIDYQILAHTILFLTRDTSLRPASESGGYGRNVPVAVEIGGRRRATPQAARLEVANRKPRARRPTP
jgi:hypothetical protein